MNMKGKSKTQKGITLVALIITIVVLLILAAVTISSIQGDGILGHATNAASSYNQAQLNEQWTIGGYENYLKNLVGGGVETPEGNDEPTEEELADMEMMRKYIMGEAGTGRSALEIANVDMSTYQVTSFKDDPESITDASTTVIVVSQKFIESGTKAKVYARYKNIVYELVADGTTFFTESMEVLYEVDIQGREGQIVAYDSNGDGKTEEWIVLTERNGLVEIVSKDVAKDANGNVLELSLGYEDTEIKGNLLKYLDLNKDNIPDDLDGDGVIEEGGVDYNKDENITSDPHDIAIASYNNAITTINNYCKSLVKEELRNKVRSVGGTNNDFTPYHSTNYDNWGKNIKVDVASTDELYKTDYERMEELGIVSTGEGYWLASRFVYETLGVVNFCVYGLSGDGALTGAYLWNVDSVGNLKYNVPCPYVRLVITNPDI